MTQKTELMPHEPPADAAKLAPITEPGEGLRLMELAIRQGGEQGVAMLERLMPIRRELQAEQAKRDFDRAMAAFQKECPVVVKEKPGADNKFMYAPIEDILSAPVNDHETISGLISRHGFSHKIDTEVEEGWVKAICTVTHSSGHSEKTSFRAPLDERNKMMTSPQKYAGSWTFAFRYAFRGAFGIVTAGEDTIDKGRSPDPGAKDAEQRALIKQLWNLLPKDIRGTSGNWDGVNEWCWREEILDGAKPEDVLPYLPPRRLQEVIRTIKTKLQNP